MFNSVRNLVRSNLTAGNHPFGNRSTRNILNYVESRNLSNNSNTIKVLFLGCNDIKNVLQAITTNSSKKLDVHVNADNSLLMARNILILQTISADDFNSESDDDLAFLWDVWYNTEWPATTRTRFLDVLESLLVSLPENVEMSYASYNTLKNLWTTWKTTLNNDASPDNPILWRDMNDANKKYAKFGIGTEILHQSKQKKVCEEANLYLRNGSCRIENDVRVVCLNPTMFDRSTVRLGSSSAPFEAYLPLDKEEIVDVEDGILTRSCLKILKNLVITYRIRRQSINITFLEDAVSFCFPMECMDLKLFHVIHCSDKITEDLGLVNLLLACRSRMETDEMDNVLLFTEMTEFNTFRVSDLENLLCCSVSVMPSIYGFRLLDHQFGFHNKSHFNAKPILCWEKQAHPIELPIICSEVFQEYLKLLARLCFNKKMGCLNNSEKEQLKMGHTFRCSPYTFHYLLDSFNQRIGKNDWWQAADFNELGIDVRFNLTRRTLQVWKNRTQELFKYTCRMQSDRSTSSDLSLLRLVCLHRDDNGNITVESENIHYIDNFSIGANDNDSSYSTISFLLPSDTKIEKTYRVILWDVLNGLSVKELGTLVTMSKTKWDSPYPFEMQRTSSPISSSEGQTIVLESCIESTTDFKIKLTFDERFKNVSGLLETNAEGLSESCTQIEVSFAQTDSNPTVITLPYPVLVEDILLMPHRDECCFDLLLKKSLNELWPCDFHQPGYKMVSNDLKPWMNKRSSEFNNALDQYLSLQFSENFPRNGVDPQSWLRDTIRFLFTSSYDYIKIVSQTREDDWLHLVFLRPILATPQGSPILITSVFDNKLARHLRNKNSLNPAATSETLIKSLQVNRERDMKTKTDEEFQLLRLMLRQNATKTIPSKWQTEKLFIGVNSPWLATFISPVYAYCKSTLDNMH